VFFFIEVGTRRVHIAGVTGHPTQTWVSQQARQLVWTLRASDRIITHLFRDNDGKYSSTFDAVVASEGIEIVRTPFRAPRANAYAERWVRSGKGRKQRSVYIQGGALQALTDWLRWHPEQAGSLFVPINKGGRLTARHMNAQSILRHARSARAAGV
jgi:transposase InsO family protein